MINHPEITAFKRPENLSEQQLEALSLSLSLSEMQKKNGTPWQSFQMSRSLLYRIGLRTAC